MTEQENILNWLKVNCSGIKNAKTRKDILPYISHQMSGNALSSAVDRRFRLIASELKYQGLIGATCDDGYFYINKDNTEDLKAALKSVAEMKSKALSMLEDSSRLEKQFNDDLSILTRGQTTLF